MSRLLAIALVALCSSLLAAPVPKEVRADFTTEGTWRMEARALLGQFDRMGETEHHWTIDATGRVKVHNGLGGPTIADTLRLVIDSKAKTADYTFPHLGTRRLGTYELTADTFRFCCSGREGEPRPDSVDAGKSVYYWAFKRVKQEAKK